jgi:eukaryotic-like serine/threonine-protein kinase
VAERFGDYDVLAQIGKGGMASVHLAKCRSDGKRVALKRLLAHHADDRESMRAFLDEARLVRHLRHPNIATTFDSGNVDGTCFIAMEYVPGHTLGQLILRCDEISATRPLHGIVPFPISVNILIQLCDALEYAHKLRDDSGKPLGIIHRDVSPANVILSSKGIVKLIDFGIAKATSQTVHSNVGVVKGKFSYMAPEYLKGNLDHRVDVWALGVVAHELLTNRRLFKGANDFETIYKVRADELVPPSRSNPDVPPELDTIVMTALQREPDARWQSAGAMRAALANAASELQVVVTNEQLIEWVDWTFTQASLDENSEVSELITLLETPFSTVSNVLPFEHTPPPHQPEPARNEPARTTPVRTEPAPEPVRIEPVRTEPVRIEPDPPAVRSSRRPIHIGVHPSFPTRPAARTTSALRVLLMICVLLAAGAFAAWYYGYVPADVTDLLGLPTR